MRLSDSQIEPIKQETEYFFGDKAEVRLFGLCVVDVAKGGDLHVRAATSGANQLAAARFAFLARLKRRMGGRKIDLVLQREGGETLPIYELVRQ